MTDAPIRANDPADMLDAALDVAAQGRRVAPIFEMLADGSCACNPGGQCKKGSPGKHPRIAAHLTKATTDPAQIRAWWKQWPTANIAIVTGVASGCVVVDLDTAAGHGKDRDGIGKFVDLCAGREDALATEIVITPSGGRHLYYDPVGAKLQSASGRLAPGVDQRCEDGYVLVPPSNHAMGGRYETLDNGAALAPLPAWLAEKMTKAVAEPSSTKLNKTPTLDQLSHATALVKKACLAIESHPRGTGGGRTEVLLPKLKAMGGVIWALGEDAVYQAAKGAVDRRGSSMPPGEVERHVRQGLAHGAESPLPLDEEPSVPEFVDAPDAKPEGIQWIRGADLERPLPETRWSVRDLQICAGRPTMFAGFGFSGKTLAGQDLLLGVASGQMIWSHFPAGVGKVVRHFDHEQGKHATVRRYQRLAFGRGIKLGELDLGVACFPEIYLNSRNARDAYAKICEGVDIALIDALRGATPGEDENDSKIRSCIDNLSWASERTGTAFVLVHHAGKSTQDDQRAAPRGSSAIFDGCGCVLILSGEKDEPKRVSQAKSPAEAEGQPIQDFALAIEDVSDGFRETAGVRVTWQALEATPGPEARFNATADAVLEFIRQHPGISSKDLIAEKMQRKEKTVSVAVNDLITRDLVRNMGTPKSPRFYAAEMAGTNIRSGDAD